MNNPIWFHIDVNNAFLSWTAVEELAGGAQRDLRTMPAIIGGSRETRHGVVLAKSMIAKSYGVRTGEPVTDALKKCPNLVLVPPNHQKYSEYSQRLMQHLRQYSPEIIQYSIDECFMHYLPEFQKNQTEAMRRQSAVAAAIALKDEIKTQFGFTVNIGISNNRLLAKMASDFEKPDKVHTLFRDEIQAKMWPLPVSDLFMVGKMSAQKLRMLGIKTIGDLAKMDPEIIESHLKSHGRTIWSYANGIEITPLDERTKADTNNKGIGNSTTLAHDVTDRKEVSKILQGLAEKTGSRLRQTNQLAGQICVEIKYFNFQSVSHPGALLTATDNTAVILKNAERLFDEIWTGVPIRLLGIRLSKLTEEYGQQLNLFDMGGKDAQKQQQLDKALDEIRNRFGKTAIMRGSAVKKTDAKFGWEAEADVEDED